jgi:hypothetical protein
LSRKIRVGSRPRRPISDFFPVSFPLWKKEQKEKLNPMVLLTGPLTRLVEWNHQEVLTTDEHFLKDHNGMNGRGGRSPSGRTATTRPPSANLWVCMAACVPVKNKPRHHPQNAHAILQNSSVETPFRGWSIMPGDHGSWPPGLTRQVVYHTTIPVH